MSKLKELKEWFWNFGGERDSLKVMLIGSFFLFVSFIFLPISGHVASVLFYTFSFLSFTINGRGLATNITFDGDWD